MPKGIFLVAVFIKNSVFTKRNDKDNNHRRANKRQNMYFISK